MSAGGQQRKPRAPPKPSPEPVPSQGHGVIKPHGGHPSGSEDQAHPRKKIRSDRGHSASWVDGTAEAVSKPASATSEDRLTPIELDAALTHELTNCMLPLPSSRQTLMSSQYSLHTVIRHGI